VRPPVSKTAARWQSHPCTISEGWTRTPSNCASMASAGSSLPRHAVIVAFRQPPKSRWTATNGSTGGTGRVPRGLTAGRFTVIVASIGSNEPSRRLLPAQSPLEQLTQIRIAVISAEFSEPSTI
jgi:hypothetical protein